MSYKNARLNSGPVLFLQRCLWCSEIPAVDYDLYLCKLVQIILFSKVWACELTLFLFAQSCACLMRFVHHTMLFYFGVNSLKLYTFRDWSIKHFLPPPSQKIGQYPKTTKKAQRSMSMERKTSEELPKNLEFLKLMLTMRRCVVVQESIPVLGIPGFQNLQSQDRQSFNRQR